MFVNALERARRIRASGGCQTIAGGRSPLESWSRSESRPRQGSQRGGATQRAGHGERVGVVGSWGFRRGLAPTMEPGSGRFACRVSTAWPSLPPKTTKDLWRPAPASGS